MHRETNNSSEFARKKRYTKPIRKLIRLVQTEIEAHCISC